MRMIKRLFMVFFGVLLGGCTGLAANLQLVSLFWLPPLPTLATLPPAPTLTSTPAALPARLPDTLPTPEAPAATSAPSPTASPTPSPSPTPYLYIQGPFCFADNINPPT